MPSLIRYEVIFDKYISVLPDKYRVNKSLKTTGAKAEQAYFNLSI